MTHTPDPAAELARLRAEVERLRKALETWHKADTALTPPKEQAS